LAATHSEDTNVVRLMSVHQSKGLEFPIVVVPDLNRVPHGGGGRVHLDARLGPLARPLSTDDEPRAVSGYDLWRFDEKVEEAAEMNRLLYVATTRAADYLILSTGVQTLGEAKSPWMQLLDRRFDLTTGRFLGELPPGQDPPQVKVTTEPPSGKAVATRGPRPDIMALATRMEGITPRANAVRAAVDPLTADLEARRQFSFSRLSGTLHRKYERLDEAATGMSGSPDPRGLGTLVHAALAALTSPNEVDIRELVEHFAEQHLPDAPAAVAEAVAMIERFATSPRARQIAAAQASHAEVEFLLAWPAADDAAGSIALRGYLDRLYQDAEGRWHVLDFKTNRVGPGGVAAVAAAYEMQMYVYALATERILKSSPSSLTLHFLRTGEEYAFAWNDAARARVEQMVNDAMAAATVQPGEPLATPS
jgi:ATP-dependent helicase/nuclease subunit A